MQDTLLTSPPVSSVSGQVNSQNLKLPSPHDFFFCPEESQFYAQCLEKMVFSQCDPGSKVIEFGAGDGSPVISALLKSLSLGIVHGYELNLSAAQVARSRIEQYGLIPHYQIHNQCFFEAAPRCADYLIANPPYLPAPDDDLYMPALHGGRDGASITKKLLSMGCNKAMLMISAYSNPIETVEHAIAAGYQVVDFLLSPLPFGYYSREPKVQKTIMTLREKGKAFYSNHIYFLAGVLFQQKHPNQMDLSEEFLKVMTVL
ncbi:MAG: SAM-dependent methyltransferase [Snowella sp.]|nr:SAM-dependent methyltransferase [Snowella sp.]